MNQTVSVNVTTLDGTSLYSQTVENLDLVGVIAAVNKPLPPPPVKRVRRKDAGKPRAAKPSAVLSKATTESEL